jgi:AcrR family transcriptional regulator
MPAMSPARNDDGDRRSHILDAAALVIAERGVDGARLADVAEAADVSLGLVQHYFRHRDRLLAEVFRRESERIELTWNEVVDPATPPLERLVDYLRLASPEGSADAALAFAPGWAFWIEFWSKAHREETVRGEVGGVYAGYGAQFAAAIDEGIAAGVFAPRSPTADVVDRLVAQIDGIAVRTLLGVIDERRMLTLLVDALVLELGLSDELAERAHAHARRRRRRRAPARRTVAGRGG